MWILESSGDFLQGKRMWLKPGQKYLFGRVKREGVRFAIDHKTVSRKHFIIEVNEVRDGDEARLHARTKITITDQQSKSGTYIDGELIKGLTRELKSAVNSIRPGNCPHELVVKWQPCVLTFNLQKKEMNSGVLKLKQDRIRQLDIKVVAEFVVGQTTHVVAAKRNTAKGLQALVNAAFLVDDSYIDVLEYASTPKALIEEEEELSLLEADFDSAWPDPKAHLPAPGKENATQSTEAYSPNASRVNVFDGCTFIFCDPNQFETLMPVITSGHGKALLFKLIQGQSTSDEIVRFMHYATGRNDVSDGEIAKLENVLLIRWISKDEPDWTNDLILETMERTGQQPVDQGEFLNAILANDASVLKVKYTPEIPSNTNSQIVGGDRTQATTRGQTEAAPDSSSSSSLSKVPPVELNGHAVQGQSQSQNPNRRSMSQQSTNSSSVQVIQRPRFRAPIANRFKQFDDGFDEENIQPYESDESGTENGHLAAGSAEVSEDDRNTMNQITSNNEVKQEGLISSKKRPRPPDLHTQKTTLNNDLDELLPAAAAMKRRKLAQQAEAGGAVEKDQAVSTMNGRKLPVKKGKKKEREIDVREAVKAQREAEEEAAEKEREQLQRDQSFDTLEKGPANLAVVISMDMPVRERNLAQTDGRHGDRWDEKWNGRKNFKKFRQQGESTPRRGQNHVIVPLVEVKKKTYGLGEQYWEKSQEEKDRMRAKKKQHDSSHQSSGKTQSRSNEPENISADEEGISEAENEEPISTSPSTTRLQQEAADILDHPVDVDAPRQTRANDSHASSVLSASQATNRMAGSKRAANAAAKPSQQTKRQKQLPVTVVHGDDSEDEDDSDDLKFKFGSRRKKAASRQ